MKRGRRRPRTLYAALMACRDVPETQRMANVIVTELVCETCGSADRLALRLGMHVRTARRLLAAYGWTDTDRMVLPP